MPKVYLDDNGNPIPAAPAAGKVYLDDNGNPIPSAAPQAAQAAAPAEPGFWENLGKSFGIDKNANAWQQWKNHPIASAVNAIGGPAYQAAAAGAGGFMRTTGELGLAVDALRAGNPAAAGVHAVTSMPFVGPALNRMADEAPASQPGQPYLSRVVADATPGNLGTALGAAAQVAPMALGAADEAFPGRPTIPNPPVVRLAGAATRRVLAGDVNAPIPGTDLTPAARYESMKAMGLQPNAAEATNSTPLNIAEKVNQNSLTAAPTYAKARAGNLTALNEYTEGVLNEMSPLGRAGGAASIQEQLQSQHAANTLALNNETEGVLNEMSPYGPEEGGAAIQQGLLKHQADLKEQAEQGFKQLDEELAGPQVLGGPGLRAEARRILDVNAPYYKLHPELEPTKALAIVKDLASSGVKTKPAAPVVTGFGPAAAEPAPVIPREMGYSELHRLRSDLLDFYNNNPDLVKNQANGWIQRLAGAADQAITSPRGSMTPEQVQTFRAANDAWRLMKDTYDNPQSPLYHAARNPSPSTLVNGIQRTPEMAQTLQNALGPQGMGPIQRGVAENVLGTGKEGGYDFGNFQGRWNKLPEDYRNALFTPEQLQSLETIGSASAKARTAGGSPLSPFYYAARRAPSELIESLPQTPEMVQSLREGLGPEGMGPIQRGVLEKALGTTKEGGYNFKTFQGQWNKLPQAYREALFTPEHIQQLEDIGNAGTVLHEDANPSGSARLGQGIAEGAEALRSVTNPHELVGNVAYHGAQYGLGRLMNSPRFVEWLMKGKGFSPVVDVAPTASAAVPFGTMAAGWADPHTGQLGQPNFFSDAYLESKARFDAARAKR